MQKWEYCVVGPVGVSFTEKKTPGVLIPEAAARFPGPGYMASLVYLNSEGLTRPRVIDSAGALATTIAALGDEGWELAGCGTQGRGDSRGTVNLEHFLYFKRPLQEHPTPSE